MWSIETLNWASQELHFHCGLTGNKNIKVVNYKQEEWEVKGRNDFLERVLWGTLKTSQNNFLCCSELSIWRFPRQNLNLGFTLMTGAPRRDKWHWFGNDMLCCSNPCGRQSKGPKDDHILIPRTWEDMAKGTFGIIKLRTRRLPWIIQITPLYSQGFLWVKEGGRRVSVRVKQYEKDLNSHCWLWRWKKAAMGQGMQMSSRSWKRHRNGFSPRVSRRNAALPTSWF